MRYLESEIEGEKLVTRNILQRAQRNGADIAAARTDIGRMDVKVDDVVSRLTLIEAAQISQGQMLNILVQEARAVRAELTEMKAMLGTILAAVTPPNPPPAGA